MVKNLLLDILSNLLLNSYRLPLYYSLIKSSFRADFSLNTRNNTAGKIGVFLIGLNTVK